MEHSVSSGAVGVSVYSIDPVDRERDPLDALPVYLVYKAKPIAIDLIH